MDSIRELQRRRRAAARARAGLEAVLAAAELAPEVEEAEEPAPPPPAKVFIVFRGARWADPEGQLRESDSIAGVYESEEAARKAIAAMRADPRERELYGDPWYQPYPVQS